MRRIATVALTVCTLAAAGAVPARATPGQAHQPVAFGKRLVVGGLADPAAFTVFPDGRILFGERLSGKIRIYDPSSGSTTPFTTRSMHSRHTAAAIRPTT